MGCISSKLMSTSVSFQEDVKHKDRSANSIHNALQELTINNHFHAAPSTNELGFQSCSTDSSKLSISLMHILLNNKPSKLESKVVQGGQVLPQMSRSRSCDSLPENEKLCKDGTEETHDWKGKSFHTVEEYDAIIQQISRLVEDESDAALVADSTVRPDKRHSDLNDTTKDSPERGKGFRRKFIARSLESLEIPRNIEFPIVGPEAYVTPKFGSYSLPKHTTANKDVFDPQLVADFEQCMQQLEAETQDILQQISEKLDQNHAKEENLSHTEP